MRHRARAACKRRVANAGEVGAERERAPITDRGVPAMRGRGAELADNRQPRAGPVSFGPRTGRQAALRVPRALSMLNPPGPYTATISSPPMIARFFSHSMVCPV